MKSIILNGVQNMARRKDHSPEELKALVIGAVLGFLQSEPAQKLSLRQLAKMVGYSPGTLINLFGSYAHLILAANAATLDLIADKLSKALVNTQNPQDQLSVIALEYLNFAKQHPFQWQILFEHHLAEEDEVPHWQLSRIDGLFTLIEKCLEQLNPHSQNDERHKASRVIWAAVHGICMLEVDNKLFAQDSVTGESMINSLLSHYLGSWKISNQHQGDDQQ